MKYLLPFTLAFVYSFESYAQSEFSQPAEVLNLNFIHSTKKLSDIGEATTLLSEVSMKKKQHEDDEMAHSGINASPKIPVHLQDEALQKNYTTSDNDPQATILSNWNGLHSGFSRSDNNIAVSPKYVVELTNSNAYSSLMRVWDKSGGVLIRQVFIKNLIGMGDWGDPDIIYDEATDRFVISFLFSGTQPSKLIIAASQTNDPTGKWFVYTFETFEYPDYEKLGAWNDSYFVTVASGHPGVYVLKKQDVLNGNANGQVLFFKLPIIPNIGWQAASPILQTGLSVANDDPVVVRVVDDAWEYGQDTDHLDLFSFKINWHDPESSTMSKPLSLPIANYNSDLCGLAANGGCFPQKNSDVKLWPCNNFIMDKAQYRDFGDHQSIVATHVTNADGEGTGGVRWYELRKYSGGAWFIFQQGTYSPTKDHRFFSSITINGSGTIALGYNITGQELDPGIRITGRTSDDSLNEMTLPETEIENGTAPNLSLNYGDYNSMVTDPSDGSFWFAAQWNPTQRWSSNIVHFTIQPESEKKISGQTDFSIENLTASPSPTDGESMISFESNEPQNIRLSVFDLNGKKIAESNFQAQKGMNLFPLGTASFSNGIYLVRIRTNTETKTLKLDVHH